MKASEFDYLMAIAVASYENYVDIDEYSNLIPDNLPTPEELILKKEWWEKIRTLSPESQAIIQYVLENQYEKITKQKISLYFREKGWKWNQIWKAFDEIKRWLNDV